MENFIIINNCTKDELKKILKDWLLTIAFDEDLESKLVFEFAEIKPNCFVLKIDKSIEGTDFFYLVNYFAYPIDFEKTFEVAGYATASKHKTILNKNIYVFIDEQDTDYDNVLITTEDNETYKYDFGDNFTKISDNNYKYIKPSIDNMPVFYEKIIIKTKEFLEDTKKIKNAETEYKLKKRFTIISTVCFIGILIAFLVKPSMPIFKDFEITLFFVVLPIYVWFTIDYKIFYNIQRTLICFLLSLLFIVLMENTKDIIITTIATIPMSSIIVVLLTNKILGKTKRESIDEVNIGWGEKILSIVQVLSSALISAFVFNPILKYIME